MCMRVGCHGATGDDDADGGVRSEFQEWAIDVGCRKGGQGTLGAVLHAILATNETTRVRMRPIVQRPE